MGTVTGADVIDRSRQRLGVGIEGVPACRRAAARRPSQRTRPIVIHSAAEVPVPLIDDFIDEMAAHLSRTREARACSGLTFTFISSDVAVAPARYEVSRSGVVRVQRGTSLPSTFTFLADAETFDSVLRGRRSVLLALLQRRIRLEGSFSRLRTLLRLMPAVQAAYVASRAHMTLQHSGRYEFAF